VLVANAGHGRKEIRKAILDVRAADKDVYCYVETVTSGLYLLASSATRLSIVPTGEVSLVGIHMEHAYYKNLLDKLHLEADMEHIGEYKSAAEPLIRTGPSPEADEMHNWLLEDLYNQLVDGIAESRGMAPEKVKELIDNGPYIAERALEAKLVDAVEYKQEFIANIKQKHGKSTRFTRNYGVQEGPDVDFSNPFAMFEAIGRMMKGETETDKPVVAIVYAEGMIIDGPSRQGMFGSNAVGSTTLSRELDKAREDEKVKAVVLRIDSPGGSSMASEIIWHAAKLLGEKKPLIVSMGNVAASGGYYIACCADTIYADPGTITGSIGVLGGKLVTKGLWDWVGVSFHENKRGRNSDLFTSNRKFDDKQREIVRQQMQDVYTVFTRRVTDGRGKKLADDIEKLARGRAYTGQIALAKGLVDKLGGLDEAIVYAAEKAKIKDYQIRILPKPKNIMDVFKQSLSKDDDNDLRLQTGAAAGPLTMKAMQVLSPAIEQIDPARAKLVARFLMSLDALTKETVLTVMPDEFLINGMGW